MVILSYKDVLTSPAKVERLGLGHVGSIQSHSIDHQKIPQNPMSSIDMYIYIYVCMYVCMYIYVCYVQDFLHICWPQLPFWGTKIENPTASKAIFATPWANCTSTFPPAAPSET